VTVAARAPAATAARADLEPWLERVLSVAFGLPLLVYASIGAYSRYTADDFCWAGILRTDGFVNAQLHYYTVYSPRYAFTLLVNAAELAGPAIVPALPAACIVLWLTALTWTFAQFKVDSLLRGLVLAEVAVLAGLQTAPDLPQSLYWQTGLLTYLLPIVLATFLVGWIRRGSQAGWAVAVSGVTTFVAGGLSETYLIPQNVALSLALLVAVYYRSRRAHLAAALFGGIAALAVILASPSMGPRVQGTPAELWLAMSAAIATGVFQVVRLARFFPLAVIVCLGVPALLGGGPPRISRHWLLLVTMGVLITLPFCYFPSFFAQNGNPPSRSLIVPGAVLVGYLLFLGFALREPAARWLPEPRRGVVLAALAIVPVGVAVTTFPDQIAAARYAALFDAEDQQIRAGRDAGLADLTVPPLPPNLGEGFVGTDRDNWFNQCVARYYGVRSIAIPVS
jgi:hypothetical protein